MTNRKGIFGSGLRVNFDWDERDGFSIFKNICKLQLLGAGVFDVHKSSSGKGYHAFAFVEQRCLRARGLLGDKLAVSRVIRLHGNDDPRRVELDLRRPVWARQILFDRKTRFRV